MAQRTKSRIDEPPQAKVDDTSLNRKTRIVLTPPISVILDKSSGGRKRKRSKRTSSRGTKRLTDIEWRVTKALRRVSRAVDHGVDTYIDHRDNSADKRRDGVEVDFFENLSYGASQALSEASPVLHDVAEMMNTRRMRKQIRRLSRGFASIPYIG